MIAPRVSAWTAVGAVVLVALLAAVPGHERTGLAPAPTRAAVAPASKAVPAAVTLTDPGVSPGAISLSWTEDTSLLFRNYTVYVANSSAGPWSYVGVVTTAATPELSVDDLAPGATYAWEVADNDGLFGSTMSNVLTVAQPGAAYLTAPSNSSTSVDLAWTNNATYGGALAFSDYTVLEIPSGGSPRTVTTISTVATLSTTVSGLTPGSGYSFYVETVDCYAGCSGATPSLSTSYSNTIGVGTPAALGASLTVDHATVDVGVPDAVFCTPSGGVAPYAFGWNFTGGTTYTAGGESEAPVFATNGSETVACRVTDNASTTADASTTIVVDPFPTVNISLNATAADVGEPIAFNCTATPGDAPIDSTWAFGDGTSQLGFGLYNNYSKAYALPGEFVASCTAVDDLGEQVSASTQVNVTADPVAGIMASTTSGPAGTIVTFHGDALDGAGGYYGFRWNFGDKSKMATTQNVTHTFASAGEFTVTFRFLDANGVGATAHVVISISAPPPGPAHWFPPLVVLGLGVLTGGVLAVGWSLRRRPEEPAVAGSEGLARWVPPTDPRELAGASTTCPRCGAANPPIRRTCRACGANLPRPPS